MTLDSASKKPATAAADVERAIVAQTSVLKTAMHCEWRLIRLDPSWWVTIALLLACGGYALHNGRIRLDERARVIAEAQRDEGQRLASLIEQLGRIERGEVKPPDAPFRDPRNAIYVGRGLAATVAYLPDAALASVAVGLSDLYPQILKVAAGSKDSFLFVDEIANPTHLLVGGFDLAFVVVYLYPLLLLALSYNVLSGEQEQGTLALTVASSAPLTTVIVGKLIVRMGGLTMATLLGIWCFLGATSPRLFEGGGGVLLALLSLVIVCYGAFWGALALFVNSFRRDSAFNAVALAMAWVVLLLVAPAALNATAQVLYPAPARAEMVLAVRNAAIDAERDRDATEARYREDHRTAGESSAARAQATTRPINDDRSRRTLAVTLAAEARADAVLIDQETRVKRQRSLSDRLAFLVPPVLINEAIVELAGSGHTRWDDYIARVGEFHTRWQKFFVERAAEGMALSSVDYSQFPRFESLDRRVNWFSSSLRRVMVAVTWVGVLSVLLFVWASHRLSRTA